MCYNKSEGWEELYEYRSNYFDDFFGRFSDYSVRRTIPHDYKDPEIIARRRAGQHGRNSANDRYLEKC